MIYAAKNSAYLKLSTSDSQHGIFVDLGSNSTDIVSLKKMGSQMRKLKREHSYQKRPDIMPYRI